MVVSLLLCLLLFTLVTTGLAWPLVAELKLDAAEKLVTAVAGSLVGTFLIGWVIYTAALPPAVVGIVPVLAAIGLLAKRRSWIALSRDPEVSALCIGQTILTAWCIGWLITVRSYSGGGWSGDWFEHWERTRFFLERWPLDRQFLGSLLPARPPLANVVTAVFLGLTRHDFAHYQFVTTVLGSLAFLPAALFVRRFSPRDEPGSGRTGVRAITVMAALLMLNPAFVQNATFAWTKLPTVFFTLAGLYFFLHAVRSERPLAGAVLTAVMLAAGTLTHYSTGPYVVLLVAGWLAVSWQRRREREWWRATLAAAAVGAAILATWFGWAIQHYGASGTLLANSSITAADTTAGGQVARIALNVRDTIVPHFLRPMDRSLIAQASRVGATRDWLFQLYQTNLLFAFGSVGWLVILVAGGRQCRDASARVRLGWCGFIGGGVLLGIGVHGARDTWGLTHICLQPLIVLGLGFLASRWSGLSRPWRFTLAAGAALDLVLGIALHFGVQAFVLEPAPGPQEFRAWAAERTMAMVTNLGGKLHYQLTFISDALPVPRLVIGAILLALLLVALARTRRREPAVSDVVAATPAAKR
ncbi:MAG: hypothetical protein Q7S40_03925 [Opitutaceae bacterium]|nr:hypothetical protein [Opitutaceae bacterium]